MKDNNKMN